MPAKKESEKSLEDLERESAFHLSMIDSQLQKITESIPAKQRVSISIKNTLALLLFAVGIPLAFNGNLGGLAICVLASTLAK